MITNDKLTELDAAERAKPGDWFECLLIDLCLENEKLRAELAELRAAKPHSLSEGKRMVSQYQALAEKLRALLTEAHAALVNADEVAPCDNAAALIERIDDILGDG